MASATTMLHRLPSLGLLLVAGLLAAPTAAATKARRATSAESQALRAEQALRNAVKRHVSDAGLTEQLASYTVFPSVVQLRRYVEKRKLKLVCVVDLAVKDQQGSLLASVRGNATAIGASPDEAVDAAALAAVAQLPQALQALRGQDRKSPTPELAQAKAQWSAPIR